MKCGVDCYMTKGTAEAVGVNSHRTHIIEAGKQFRVGTWTILPFETIHNAPEAVGFILASEGEKLLFCTDTQYIHPTFQGLNYIMIEIDFDMDILQENVRQGSDMAIAKNVIRYHMSLETAKDFFKANDMSKVREIHLLHLSNNNSNAGRFKMEIQCLTGRPVYIGG